MSKKRSKKRKSPSLEVTPTESVVTDETVAANEEVPAPPASENPPADIQPDAVDDLSPKTEDIADGCAEKEDAPDEVAKQPETHDEPTEQHAANEESERKGEVSVDAPPFKTLLPWILLAVTSTITLIALTLTILFLPRFLNSAPVAPAVTEPTCTECGRPESEVVLYSKGYCAACFKINHKGDFGFCDECEAALTEPESLAYDGLYCENCAVCLYCSKSVTADAFDTAAMLACETCFATLRCTECDAFVGDQSYGGLCENCETFCVSCGKAKGDATFKNSMCDVCRSSLNYGNCFECGAALKEDGFGYNCYWCSPNIFCPNCDYQAMTSGVGIDGIYCPWCNTKIV